MTSTNRAMSNIGRHSADTCLAQVISCARGRGLQLNAGWRMALAKCGKGPGGISEKEAGNTGGTQHRGGVGDKGRGDKLDALEIPLNRSWVAFLHGDSELPPK